MGKTLHIYLGLRKLITIPTVSASPALAITNTLSSSENYMLCWINSENNLLRTPLPLLIIYVFYSLSNPISYHGAVLLAR